MKFKRIMESEQKFNTGDKVTFFGNPCTVVSVDFTGGKLASVTIKDDVAGWTNNVLVNDPNPITAKNFSHLKKVEGDGEMVKEETTSYEDTDPKVYVTTYAKYNNGDADGEWVTLTDFDTYEDFVDYCREINKDEKDPEFMCTDSEYFPKSWYHESGLPSEETFNKIMEFSELDDSERRAFAAYAELVGDEYATIDNFQDAYRGQYDSPTDFAESMIDEMGFETAVGENADWYFDYESFGRDLMYDYHMGDPDNEDADGEPEDETHYYDTDGTDLGEFDSNYKVGEDLVDSMGGVKELGQETIQRYFDYEKYGNDLMAGDFAEQDGYYFWRN